MRGIKVYDDFLGATVSGWLGSLAQNCRISLIFLRPVSSNTPGHGIVYRGAFSVLSKPVLGVMVQGTRYRAPQMVMSMRNNNNNNNNNIGNRALLPFLVAMICADLR